MVKIEVATRQEGTHNNGCTPYSWCTVQNIKTQHLFHSVRVVRQDKNPFSATEIRN